MRRHVLALLLCVLVAARAARVRVLDDDGMDDDALPAGDDMDDDGAADDMDDDAADGDTPPSEPSDEGCDADGDAAGAEGSGADEPGDGEVDAAPPAPEEEPSKEMPKRSLPKTDAHLFKVPQCDVDYHEWHLWEESMRMNKVPEDEVLRDVRERKYEHVHRKCMTCVALVDSEFSRDMNWTSEFLATFGDGIRSAGDLLKRRAGGPLNKTMEDLWEKLKARKEAFKNRVPPTCDVPGTALAYDAGELEDAALAADARWVRDLSKMLRDPIPISEGKFVDPGALLGATSFGVDKESGAMRELRDRGFGGDLYSSVPALYGFGKEGCVELFRAMRSQKHTIRAYHDAIVADTRGSDPVQYVYRVERDICSALGCCAM